MTEREGEKKYKIIIVDDDDFLLNMYASKFGESEVEVLACKSGKELLEKLSAGEAADLILLDIVLPELDGLETLLKVRQEKLGQGIPVVMLTNQSDTDGMSKSGNLDIAGYIVKASATPSEVVEQSLKIIRQSKKQK